MASPLLSKRSTDMNIASPHTTIAQKLSDRAKHSQYSSADAIEDLPSSPFVQNVPENEPENVSPMKLAEPSHSAIERQSTSPLKMLKSRGSAQSPIKPEFLGQRSPRKISSPEKRFPIKVDLSPEKRTAPGPEPLLTRKDIFRHNEGLVKALQILEDEESILNYGETNEGSDETTESLVGDNYGEGSADLSTFSAIQDMTMFSKIGNSPTKYAVTGQTPRRNQQATPATVRLRKTGDHDTSPTPRRYQQSKNHDLENTTNLILDFTEQFNSISSAQVPSSCRNQASPSKNHTLPDFHAFTLDARTPSPAKNRNRTQSPIGRMSTLLDFDIPPAPTPRSMPSITLRELETLKSSFLSEISNLKASLSGKEAETLSLKTAVGDAEKRVGECMEQIQEERNLKEQLAADRENWEKRGSEMELVLRNIREEIVKGERERASLEGMLEESEKRREAAEMMAQEAESKIAGMRAGANAGEPDGEDKRSAPGSTGREVDIAVEKVARELHTLYKSKHETKVAALKKSYEGRWERKVRDLEAKLNEISRENELLKLGKDATMSGVAQEIQNSDNTEELKLKDAKDAMAVKEMEAKVEGLSEEIKRVKLGNKQLRHELELERIEKGELVAACDELLALQELASSSHPAATSAVENFKGSISRASGLRPSLFSSGLPQPGESRIGKGERSGAGSAQGVKPSSGPGYQSGIMTSIERMGSYKGRAD